MSHTCSWINSVHVCAPSCVARHVQDRQDRHVQDRQEYAEVTSGNGAVLINEQQEKHGHQEFLEKSQVLMESHKKISTLYTPLR